MDEQMCRPGYRWNDTLKRCLSAGGGNNTELPTPKPEKPGATPEPPPGQKPGAPAKPAKGGRGAVRVNSSGVKQTGTSMGTSISL